MGQHALYSLGTVPLALALLLSSCGKTGEVNAGGDTQTNWLRTCNRDADCGEFACLCGVCSLSCSESDDCGDAPSGASCRAPGSEATSAVCGASAEVGLCLVTCTSDAECPTGQRCEGDACVPRASTDGGAGSGDQATGGSSTSGGAAGNAGSFATLGAGGSADVSGTGAVAGRASGGSVGADGGSSADGVGGSRGGTGGDAGTSSGTGGTPVTGAAGGTAGTAGLSTSGGAGASASGGSTGGSGSAGATGGLGGVSSAGNGGVLGGGGALGTGGTLNGTSGQGGGGDMIECRPRPDDPTGYLVKICEFLAASDNIYVDVDPNLYNIESIATQEWNGRDVIWVYLDCCYMGDIAFIDPETEEVLDFSPGDV